jgi:hypothetical protein
MMSRDFGELFRIFASLVVSFVLAQTIVSSTADVPLSISVLMTCMVELVILWVAHMEG